MGLFSEFKDWAAEEVSESLSSLMILLNCLFVIFILS